MQNIYRYASVFRMCIEAINSRQIDQCKITAINPAQLAVVLLYSDPGIVGDLCRSPVRRLNSVDLPEFGGPTSATVWILPATRGVAAISIVAVAQQSLIAPLLQLPARKSTALFPGAALLPSRPLRTQLDRPQAPVVLPALSLQA